MKTADNRLMVLAISARAARKSLDENTNVRWYGPNQATMLAARQTALESLDEIASALETLARPEPSAEADLRSAWLVWSFEHDAWWGPNHGGYYTSILSAGIYTEAVAKHIERSANRDARKRNEEARSLFSVMTNEAKHARPNAVIGLLMPAASEPATQASEGTNG